MPRLYRGPLRVHRGGDREPQPQIQSAPIYAWPPQSDIKHMSWKGFIQADKNILHHNDSRPMNAGRTYSPRVCDSCAQIAPVLAHVAAQEEQDLAFPRRVAQQRRHVVLVRRVDGGDEQILRASAHFSHAAKQWRGLKRTPLAYLSGCASSALDVWAWAPYGSMLEARRNSIDHPWKS